MTKEELMRRAIELSADSVRNGGGPFGAVIARNGEIIAEGSNGVTIYNDPTAHAEVSTIRKACQKLNTFDLSGCEIYTNLVRCALAQSIGHTSIRSTMPTTAKMLLTLVLMTISSIRR